MVRHGQIQPGAVLITPTVLMAGTMEHLVPVITQLAHATHGCFNWLICAWGASALRPHAKQPHLVIPAFVAPALTVGQLTMKKLHCCLLPILDIRHQMVILCAHEQVEEFDKINEW